MRKNLNKFYTAVVEMRRIKCMTCTITAAFLIVSLVTASTLMHTFGNRAFALPCPQINGCDIIQVPVDDPPP